MTENPEPINPTTTNPTPPESELITKLRDEMQQQYNALKEAMDSALKERDAEIAKLSQEKQVLQNALVVSSISPKTEELPPKTEAEQYQENIQKLAAKTLHLMEGRC
jgi:hypothetical protein